MQKNIEQKEEWDNIWKRKGLLDRIIDFGRTTYNLFFRRLLRKYINKDSTILELGCGRASLTISLASEIQRLVGVDISETALDQAQKYAKQRNLGNTEFYIDDCTRMKTEERFDVVWSQGLMEHFENPEIVAQEHFRMLKPGGVALISIPYRYSYHRIWYILTRHKLLQRFWPWTEQQFFNKKMLVEIGKKVTPNTRAFLLQPSLLGIAILELRRSCD